MLRIGNSGGVSKRGVAIALRRQYGLIIKKKKTIYDVGGVAAKLAAGY